MVPDLAVPAAEHQVQVWAVRLAMGRQPACRQAQFLPDEDPRADQFAFCTALFEA